MEIILEIFRQVIIVLNNHLIKMGIINNIHKEDILQQDILHKVISKIIHRLVVRLQGMEDFHKTIFLKDIHQVVVIMGVIIISLVKVLIIIIEEIGDLVVMFKDKDFKKV